MRGQIFVSAKPSMVPMGMGEERATALRRTGYRYPISGTMPIPDTLSLHITVSVARDLAEATKARRTHYSTSIEGNSLSLGQVEEVIKGKAHGARPSAEQEVINYWNALTFLDSSADGGRDRSEELINEAARDHHAQGQ